MNEKLIKKYKRFRKLERKAMKQAVKHHQECIDIYTGIIKDLKK